MAGSKLGGARAAATNKLRHGEDFYVKIGSMGGKKGTTGGFYANRELARTAGAKGGRKSTRKGVKNRPAQPLVDVMVPIPRPKKRVWDIFRRHGA